MPERYIGQHLGRFRIDALIGTGGFAWVYKGYDPELDIPVAIKVLKPQFAGEEAFESRFRREAATAAKLRHPNIIRILAVGREGTAVYFVMDYLPTALDDRLQIMGTLPEVLLIRLGMDVAAALAFAHREGVIHRDVKTDNILFDSHGNGIVADFGIARTATNYVEQTGTNMVVGTPQYFSPEQARGQALDGRADIYSLGVTLFKAGTGVLPFQGDDWYEIARSHVEDPPPAPRAFNPSMSREMEALILKCLEKQPADRFPTADAMHTALTQLLGRASAPLGESTVVMRTPSGPSPVLEITKPTGWRNPHVRQGTAVLALVAVMGTALIIRRATEHDARAAEAPRASNPAAAPAPPTPPTTPPSTDAPHELGLPRDVASALAAAASDTVAPPRRVRFVAPSSALVMIDGSKVGTGTTTIDALRAGMHRVSAMLPDTAGCPSARVASTLLVNSSAPREVHLTPRECGRIAVDVHPPNAHILLLGTATDTPRTLHPASPAVTVPVGTYDLKISAAYCADYNGPVTIKAGETEKRRVRLICQ